MNTIIIKTQAEYDALPASFQDFTEVHIKSDASIRITINKTPTNSRVEAWGSSRVEARESSSVEAWGSSRVEAWGSSRVVAWGSVSVHCHSNYSTITLYGYAIAILVVKTKNLIRKSRTATIITPKQKKGVQGWLETEGVKAGAHVILFKRVSKDFKTQEGQLNETTWVVGSTLDHKDYNPKRQECGTGKFHACSRPYFCDQFRDKGGDVYIALNVERKTMHAWPNPGYPHKIAFKTAKVLYQCDKFGDKI